ncbi:type III pantothenate kinase [candidate division KSB3 bacterium]|uniref:Type III pantothenate kinase n=1 Tax=candidate division KSB3 bacterium TaxID=2044937 RepID=A0A9D5JZL2_9BACT|nr:type III pantothenate kinase [candidate division KSB3 bacterium]MBD3326945.1 type III pantothenate kinase [candidate division KSB3 bacterium]
MELLFDIGNTHTVIGLHLEDKSFQIWRVGTKSFETEDELFSRLYTLFQVSGIEREDITKIGVASVVPSVNYIVTKLGVKYFHVETVFVTTSTPVFGIEYHADYPQEIGADRLANVFAARKDYGENVIAIDFGTAITIDVIQAGNFIGGAILPGFRMAMLALFANTAQLPQVELQIPDHSVGTNTVDNIQIGILKISILGIERLIQEIQRETSTEYTVVATGGIGKFLQGSSAIFDTYDPDLTLKGILYFLQEAR